MKHHTLLLRVDPLDPETAAISRAGEVIRQGGLVAFPTETVYGLGANALDAEAVRRIFAAKGRPLDNPIIVHVGRPDDLATLVEDVPAQAFDLAETFWPGPLTLVLKKTAKVPDVVTAGQETVAVRMPRNKVALALIRASGVPIAAPSANLSERPSSTTGDHVFHDLSGKIDLVLDAGPVEIGVESTVLDISTQPPAILRPGAVTAEDLEPIIGPVLMGAQKEVLARSPGTRHRHYSPRARVVLIEEESPAAVERYTIEGGKIGIITRRPDLYPDDQAFVVQAMPADLEQYARQMFAALRRLDEEGVSQIIVAAVEETGIGVAIMDRLRRAASDK
ncbi:MAG: threonylcarbamoyl-AMP synthase [Chloroflexi bacterium]|nr:MAG: threonylcarbamoyl-AMP synthase [Chloroflexota bacterium]